MLVDTVELALVKCQKVGILLVDKLANKFGPEMAVGVKAAVVEPMGVVMRSGSVIWPNPIDELDEVNGVVEMPVSAGSA